jgi:hypothetical protein
MSRRAWCSVLALALAGFGMAATADPPKAPIPAAAADSREPEQVVSQDGIGEHASAPCALLNALKFGGAAERAAAAKIPGEDDAARVRTLIATYGNKPSEKYPDRKRFEADRGCDDHELLEIALDTCRSLDLKPVAGAWFDHGKNENSLDQLVRIHGLLRRSLDDGFPPIVLLGSNCAANDPSDPYAWSWSRVDEHWACIVGLPEKLEPGALGFAFRFADSSTGKVQEAYFYAEQFHSFSGRKGNDRKSAWVVGRPFLLAVMPCLPLSVQKAPWFLRTTITLECGILREPAAPAGGASPAAPAGSASPAARAQRDPAAPTVVSHSGKGNSCGPCALLNALKFGGAAERAAVAKIPGADDPARVRSLIAAYGNKPSELVPSRKRFEEIRGCTPHEEMEMASDMCRALDLKPVTGTGFGRANGESSAGHVRRIYIWLRRSLDDGFPPIVSVSSWDATGEPSNPDGWTWKRAGGHDVCIVGLPEKLEPGALGFAFRFADSYSGKVAAGYFYADQYRTFGPPNRIYNAPQYLEAVAPVSAWGIVNTQRLWYLHATIRLDAAVFRVPATPAGAP